MVLYEEKKIRQKKNVKCGIMLIYTPKSLSNFLFFPITILFSSLK